MQELNETPEQNCVGLTVQREARCTNDLLYFPHFLANSAKSRSANSIIGIIHAVRKSNGDNFNASLCGKSPRPKSMGWIESSKEVTCIKCKAMMGI